MFSVKKTEKTLLHLAGKDGQEALSFLHESLEKFRSMLPEEVDNAEFKYITSTLTSQRSADYEQKLILNERGHADIGAFKLQHGFVVKEAI